MPAQMLFMALTNTNPDPEADRGCYKEGDLVVIKEGADNIWGRAEQPPVFFIVTVSDADRVELERFQDALEEITLVDNPERPEEPEVVSQMLRRKRCGFDFSRLPAQQYGELMSTGRVTTRLGLLELCVTQRLE